MKNVFVKIAAGIILLLSSCEADNSAGPGADGITQGIGGSMARFAVSGDYLYTVDDAALNLFDISNPKDPVKGDRVNLGFGVETIFPYGNNLFIGTQTGMQIMNISDPAAPKFVSNYRHVVACDPVVTDGRYAYITLRTGTACMQAVNQLQIVDIQNINQPTLVQQYDMTNPKGLGIDGNLLFVCDDGLKVYDATDVMQLKLLKKFNVSAYDVIPVNGRLMLVGSDGFYQYQYQDNELSLLSKIEIIPKS